MTIFFYDHEDGSVEESGYETLEDLLRPTWTDGPGPVECGKLHMRAFVGPNTVCRCGRNLHRKAWS